MATTTLRLTVTDTFSPSGISLIDTSEVTISVANVAPMIALSGNEHADEGATYALTLGTVTDPGSETIREYRVHWGDNSTDVFEITESNRMFTRTGPPPARSASKSWTKTARTLPEHGT